MNVHILVLFFTPCSLVGVFNDLEEQTALVRHGPWP